jgi:hypothetical protein
MYLRLTKTQFVPNGTDVVLNLNEYPPKSTLFSSPLQRKMVPKETETTGTSKQSTLLFFSLQSQITSLKLVKLD